MEAIMWTFILLAVFGLGGGLTWAVLKFTSVVTGAGAKGIEKAVDAVTPNTNENIKILLDGQNEIRSRNGMKPLIFAVENAKKDLENKQFELAKAQAKVDKIESKHLKKEAK